MKRIIYIFLIFLALGNLTITLTILKKFSYSDISLAIKAHYEGTIYSLKCGIIGVIVDWITRHWPNAIKDKKQNITMQKEKPYYDNQDNTTSLVKEDFNISILEKYRIISFYKRVIDFDMGKYNYTYINSCYSISYLFSIQGKSEKEVENFINNKFKDNKIIFALPVVFTLNEINEVVNSFSPSVIAKVESLPLNYYRILNSEVADYSYDFFIIAEDFSFLLIVKDKRFILKLDNNITNKVDKKTLKDLLLELNEEDRSVISKLI